jgi:hypothetical protein
MRLVRDIQFGDSTIGVHLPPNTKVMIRCRSQLAIRMRVAKQQICVLLTQSGTVNETGSAVAIGC